MVKKSEGAKKARELALLSSERENATTGQIQGLRKKESDIPPEKSRKQFNRSAKDSCKGMGKEVPGRQRVAGERAISKRCEERGKT